MAPERSRKARIVYLTAILAVAYAVFFYNLGAYSLKEPDEGRYAEIPREMVEQGDYLVPHLDYVRYFEKPPLLYWACAASYKVFGINEWSFRLPNAASALVCAFATYLFAARLFSAQAGFMSALILMTSFGFFGMARIGTIDMLLSFLLSAAVFSFYEFYRTERRRFLYLFSAALALAALAKGPVAVILPAVTVVIFLCLEKRISFLKKLASARALLLFAAVCVPWFIAICMREKEFFQFFFIDQNLLRFVTTKHHRSGPIYYFLPVIFGGLFPWSLFIPRAVACLWRRRELRLLWIWCCVVFIFFSLSGSKLPPYILPLFPAACVILGCLFQEMRRGSVRPGAENICFALFFAVVAAAGLYVSSGRADRLLSDMAELTAMPAGAHGLALWISSASLVALAALASKKARRPAGLFVLLAAFSLSICVGIMVQVRMIDGLNTTKELAREAQTLRTVNTAIVNYGVFDETLPFYVAGRTYIADYKGELEMGSKYPDSKGTFLGTDAFLRMFRSDRPVLVVFKESRINRLRRLGIDEAPVMCHADRCLIANLAASAGAAGIIDGRK